MDKEIFDFYSDLYRRQIEDLHSAVRLWKSVSAVLVGLLAIMIVFAC